MGRVKTCKPIEQVGYAPSVWNLLFRTLSFVVFRLNDSAILAMMNWETKTQCSRTACLHKGKLVVGAGRFRDLTKGKLLYKCSYPVDFWYSM